MEMIKIVAADDNEKMRNVIREIVSGDEHMKLVGMAQNGLETCALIREKQPDVLLLDLIMPKMDGMTVLERLNDAAGLKKRPAVIMISAVGSEAVIREAYRKGAIYYFIKPFDTATLLDRIRAAARDGGAHGAFPREIGPCESANGVSRREIGNLVTDIFHKLGIPAHLKGYQYLRDAILQMVFSDSHLCMVTKDIYPAIAERYQVNTAQVERAMRTAIEIGWRRGNIHTIDQIFGYTVQYERGKPTNAEFIALIADRLKMEYL